MPLCLAFASRMHIGTDQGRTGHHRRHVSLADKRCEHPVEHTLTSIQL